MINSFTFSIISNGKEYGIATTSKNAYFGKDDVITREDVLLKVKEILDLCEK